MKLILLLSFSLLAYAKTNAKHQQKLPIRLVPDKGNPDYASAEQKLSRCKKFPFEGPAGACAKTIHNLDVPDYIRSWSKYSPYLYIAEPAPAVEGEEPVECGLVIMINGRDMNEGENWKWTWTWPWHFLKMQLEREGGLSRVLLLTPQPSRPSSSLYSQINDVANQLNTAITRNTSKTSAAAGGNSGLQGSNLLAGCLRVRVYVNPACHGSIVARALLTTDRRVYQTNDKDGLSAFSAVSTLHIHLSSPFFSLYSITFTVPALAGIRIKSDFFHLGVSAARDVGRVGGGGAAAALPAGRSFLRLFTPKDQDTTLDFCGESGPVYFHLDDAKMLCSLAASESQPDTRNGSSSTSLLLQFKLITVFATLEGDVLVSPRAGAGVSDEFQTSIPAKQLIQRAEAAAAALAEGGQAAESADLQALLPHRLPVESAPLTILAASDPMNKEVQDLLYTRDVCRRVRGDNTQGQLYDLTLQLLQLWNNPAQQQLQQQQQQQGPTLNRFVVYVPHVPGVNEPANTPHFLAFASRSWMLPSATPLLRALAAAAAGSSDFQQLAVMNTNQAWWHAPTPPQS